MRPSQIHRCQIRPVGLLAILALLCGPAAAHERPSTTPAARFLQDNLERALLLAHPPVSAKASADLDIVIRDAMDWPGLTQFAIGHYGANLDEGGLSDAAARVERQLGILARRAGKEMPTLTVAIRDMRIGPDGNRHILSTATVPRFGEIEVDWTLVPTAAGYRVADVAAFGLTLRQFLRGWVTALVAAQGGDATAVFNDGAATSPQ
jgi:hypothetical protein